MGRGGKLAGGLWRVGLYIRLSRDDGREESLSVQNQRKILLDYLEHEFQGQWELAGIYVDDGLTGTDDSRESFQRMIGDMKAGKLNCIVCKTLSRAFRNYADQGYFLEEVFPRYRTRFISLGSPRVDSFLDPEAVQMGLEIPINGILNDRYAAKTSADVRRTLGSTTAAMEAWNATRRSYGAPIPFRYAFKRIWEGGHGRQSQHYAGVSFDVGQALTQQERNRIYNTARNLDVWSYVEPISMTPTWVHFDKRQGPPACRAGYPTLRIGSRGVYVLVLQDALNALGYNTYTLDGAFGNNTRNALISFQRNNNLRADGIAGCNTWTRLVDEAVGIGRTPTVIDP